MFHENSPIFQQVAQIISDDILNGTYEEGASVASTNDFASFYRINPATAGKGINLLVDQGILYKQRGIGMFVAHGAREKLRQHRLEEFRKTRLREFLHEAHALGLSIADVQNLIDQEFPHD